MKIFYKFLILIVIIISVLAYSVLSKYESEAHIDLTSLNTKFGYTQEELIATKDELVVSDVTELETIFPLNTMYKVDNGKGYLYTLSYKPEGNKLQVGSKIKYKNMLSDQLYLILRESYPNVSLEEMGLNTAEEAYQATQLAIWEVGMRTNEAREWTELSRIESIKNDMGLKNVNLKVFEKATSLVRMSEESVKSNEEIKSQIEYKPTLIVRTLDVVGKEYPEDGYTLVGPYSYRIDVGILKNVEIESKDESGNILGDVEIVDSNLNKIAELNKTNEFYVKYPVQKYDFIEFTVKADISRIVTSTYEDEYSDYLVNTHVNSRSELPLKIVK